MWRFCRGLKTPAGLLLHTETKMSIRSFLGDFARSPSHKRWFIDWAACTLMLLLYRGILHHRSDGFHQQFTLNDPSIQHPHTDNQRVPEHLLTLLSVVLPISCIIFCSMLLKQRWARLNMGLLGFAMTIVITGCITELGKNLVGRPRPDFLARCKPTQSSIQSSKYHSLLVDYTICSTPITSHTLADGFKSFPSGHSSMAFSGLTFLAWYIRGFFTAIMRKLTCVVYEQVPDEEPIRLEEGLDREAEEVPQHLVLSSLVLPLVPVILAAYISVSRLMDYRHHPTDILAGTILGASVATAVYHVYHKSHTIKA